MSQSYSFNLVDEPWLPCVGPNDNHHLLSLTDALMCANELRELSGDSPLETLALHRLLLAILHRLFGPEDYEAWESLWIRGHFPPAPIEKYLSTWRHRFDLFHPQQPFYQSEDPRAKPKSVISLMLDMASGNNPAFFDHHTEEGGAALEPSSAARAIVTAQAFALAGPCDPSQKLYFTDGACARGVLFLVEGDNLFQTLLLNMIQYPAQEPIPTSPEDTPAWEMDDPLLPEREMPLGYLDYLTWQNRRILLLPESSDQGPVVRQMTWSPALRLNPDLLDPFKHHRRDEKRGYLPLRFREERALWRDSATLFSLHGSQEQHAPHTFRWLHELVSERILDRERVYRSMALGMASDQAKVFFFREERLPFPLVYLDQAQLVVALREATNLAEQAARQLWGVIHTMADLLLSPGSDREDGPRPAREDLVHLTASWDTERNYWRVLELPFQRLVVDLPNDPDGALTEWQEIVRRVTWQTFEDSAALLGDDSRALKAVVRGRQQLGAGLRKVFSSLAQPETA